MPRLVHVMIMGLVLALTGCATYQGHVIDPGTNQIQLHVYIMVHSNDTVGFRNNVGCRLSENEVNAVVNKMIDHQAIYGTGTKFLYDAATDLQIFSWNWQGTSQHRWFGQDVMGLVLEAGYWDPNAINIYFVGYDTGDAPQSVVYGLTTDPAGTGLPITAPIIVINDGGYVSGDGFATIVGNFEDNPQRLLDANTLSHEMAHYLGRFANRTIQDRKYDSNEHALLNFGDGRHALLRTGGRYDQSVSPPIFTPYDLNIHGDETNPGNEKYEIHNRIMNGQWNQP